MREFFVGECFINEGLCEELLLDVLEEIGLFGGLGSGLEGSRLLRWVLLFNCGRLGGRFL
jgi:hypothetical protein